MSNCYIIAEAGVNHNGDLSRAREMIMIAKEAGADAVKFQLFQADKLVTMKAEQAAYQKKSSLGTNSQYDMLKSLELSQPQFVDLLQWSKACQIDFLLTPFDLEALHFISNVINLPTIKIGSGDITNGPLLFRAGQSKKRIILSTGMSTLGEIENALNVLAFGWSQEEGRSFLPDRNYYFENYPEMQKNITLLHCTSEYPAPIHEVNLRAIDTLHAAFGLSVGLSDHTLGIEVAIGAVARGAAVIEKHFTLDKNLPGPDHQASLDVSELTNMIKSIRHIEMALGDGIKRPTSAELKNRNVVRRALVASEKISVGQPFSENNIAIKRPGNGLSPMQYWQVLGRCAEKDYEPDEAILC